VSPAFVWGFFISRQTILSLHIRITV